MYNLIKIPNLTKKWKRKEGEVTSDFEDVPDSVIVIDNSGSMPDPRGDVSVPILGATAISNAYLDNNSRVAVYNFGGQDYLLNFTKDTPHQCKTRGEINSLPN